MVIIGIYTVGYSDSSNNRHIKYPMLPTSVASKFGNSQHIRIPPKQNGELRILSADIALMSSRKHDNDATSIFINQLVLTKAGRYTSNIVYTNSYEGMHTADQALMIRKLFDEYSCDYLVLDANGVGHGVFDCLVRDIVDPNTGEVYPAISCCNNSEMAARCVAPTAEKVIWAIKANAQFNSDCAFLLREGFRSGRIRLLISESDECDFKECLSSIKGFEQASDSDSLKVKLPYIQTTLLVNELVNLQHEESGGKIRIFEKSGMRKDRYSSLSYNYFVAIQLENKLAKKKSLELQTSDLFVIKAPSYKGKAVNESIGNRRKNNYGIR